MLRAQIEAVQSVEQAFPQIEAAARLMSETIRAGGTLVYVAAGSSGLIGLADGAELPGTFGTPQTQIRILMAGGVPQDGVMPGNTEDETADAQTIADGLAPTDLVIALSASGTTPYPCEIARCARARGIRIVGIANNAPSPLLELADVAIHLPTPPEVLAGSTRLGAGTAQKVTLNMMSTLAGVLLGHVHDGLMVNLHADNAKLRQRAAHIVAKIATVPPDRAARALDDADGNTKIAALIASGCDAERAKQLLQDNKGHLRPCLEQLSQTPCG